jgi:hypothetical protein
MRRSSLDETRSSDTIGERRGMLDSTSARVRGRRRGLLQVMATCSQLAIVAAACTPTVEGRWGDLANGGDVSLLRDRGSLCRTWNRAEADSPPPACKQHHGDPNDPVCATWAASALPPEFPAVGQCWGATCEFQPQYPDTTLAPCVPGPDGDAYCSAWAQAWLVGDAVAVTKCTDVKLCVLEGCFPTADGPPSSVCADNELCVRRGQGAPHCEVPCTP